jgi:hypothetical protein
LTNEWILHHDSVPAHKTLTVKQFVTQNSITEMEYSPCSPDLAPNDFWLFLEIMFVLKERFQDIEYIQKNMTALKVFHKRSSKNTYNNGSIVLLNA